MRSRLVRLSICVLLTLEQSRRLSAQTQLPQAVFRPLGLSGSWEEGTLAVVGTVRSASVRGRNWNGIRWLTWCESEIDVRAVLKGEWSGNPAKVLWAGLDSRDCAPTPAGEGRIEVWLLRQDGGVLRLVTDGGGITRLFFNATWPKDVTSGVRARALFGCLLLSESAFGPGPKSFSEALVHRGSLAQLILGDARTEAELRNLLKSSSEDVRREACRYLRFQMGKPCS